MTRKQKNDVADLFIIRMYMYNKVKDDVNIPGATLFSLSNELTALWQMCNKLGVSVKMRKDDSSKYVSVVLDEKEYKV